VGDRLAPAPAGEGPDPRDQFREGEGLHQVVVGAGVQAAHAGIHRILGREDQHRKVEAPLPKGLQDLEAAASREHEIQEQQIEGARGGQEEGILAGMGGGHFVPLRLQALLQGHGHLHFVLDQKNMQAASLAFAINMIPGDPSRF